MSHSLNREPPIDDRKLVLAIVDGLFPNNRGLKHVANVNAALSANYMKAPVL